MTVEFIVQNDQPPSLDENVRSHCLSKCLELLYYGSKSFSRWFKEFSKITFFLKKITQISDRSSVWVDTQTPGIRVSVRKTKNGIGPCLDQTRKRKWPQESWTTFRCILMPSLKWDLMVLVKPTNMKFNLTHILLPDLNRVWDTW